MYHHQQRCVDIICNQKSHITYKHIFAQHVSYISSTHFLSWRRYTFLRVRLQNRRFLPHPQKKLVAATYGVCMFIHKLSLPHITPIIIYPFIFATNAYVICNGGSHPAAIYVVRTIYTPTNNVVPIQYHPKNLIPNGGDTPFYAFGYEIEDFYLTRKKTGRRYVRRMRIITIV